LYYRPNDAENEEITKTFRFNLSTPRLPVMLAERDVFYSPFQIRKRFMGVVANDEVGLAVVSAKQWCWRILLQDGKIQLHHGWTSAARFPSQVLGFQGIDWLKKQGYRLTLAQWKDGSRAWLDSRRGMLHLRSANPRVPEVSIILCEGETSGWCSDGRTWGNPYFLGDDPNADPRDIYKDVFQPFLEQLP
jgi:hypothetical protein